MVGGHGAGGWPRVPNNKENHWPEKLASAASWRWWKRPALPRFSFLDDLLFRVLSCLEAVVLVGALCFFYLCCGCHL
ncbi:unnamed protein product [Musa acuminata subsp. burmannicoides]|uniref:(wild Malaysian banana) hypothetical protein n=1 Tax=Musa acuminata subsp. malaccensis TaxID=214687 RepID=A0A804IM99_MUSAM|nr:unnamed protein product [Musa acuminata subsp. malaccensis]